MFGGDAAEGEGGVKSCEEGGEGGGGWCEVIFCLES